MNYMDIKQENNNIDATPDLKEWISPELLTIEINKTLTGTGASLEDFTSYQSI